MTQIQVGWFGTGNPQTQVGNIDDQSDGIRVAGRISTADPTELVALRTQLLGLAAQTQAVPVIIDTAPHLNGWYTVEDVSIDVERGGLAIGWWPYSIDLARTGRMLAPVQEARIVGALRTNAQSRTTCVGWWAIPVAATLEDGPGNLVAPTIRLTADGAVKNYTAGTNGLLDTTVAYRAAPETALIGAARISEGNVDSAASTTFAAVGKTETYVVPDDVYLVRIDARGAAGGGRGGGQGARVICQRAVTPGDLLEVRVGRQGRLSAGGWNGGGAGGYGGYSSAYGGGGRTQVVDVTDNLEIVVAGGGGGQGAYMAPATFRRGGAGGWNGQDGQSGPSNESGKGGTATAGGAGGGPDGDAPGFPGIAEDGGKGASGHVSLGLGGGGGGGGLYGGGGGSAFHIYVNPAKLRFSGAGAGGSSFALTGSSSRIIGSYQDGDGAVIITPVVDEVLDIDRDTVTGLDIDSPFGWQLDNSILCVTPVFRADAFMLDLSCWNGETWSTARRWQLVDTNAMEIPAAMGPTGVQVVSNTFEKVTIRVTMQASAMARAATMTLTLRRGSPLIECALAGGAELDWGWSVVDPSAGTSVTGGGIVATTADGDGNKWLAATAEDSSKVLTGNSGWSYAADPTGSNVTALGFLPAGWTETATNLVEQWFAATSGTVRPVSS